MQRLVDNGVDAGPVVDAEGKVVGMLSTGDLIVQESQLHAPTVINILGGLFELPGEQEALRARAGAGGRGRRRGRHVAGPGDLRARRHRRDGRHADARQRHLPACRSSRTGGWSASSPGATSSGRSSPPAEVARAGASHLGRGRPRRGGPQRGLLVERAAPAEVCAVVKADGYGHGAVPVARAALDAGAPLAGRGPRRGGRRAPRRRHRRPDPAALRGPPRRVSTRWRRSTCGPTVYTPRRASRPRRPVGRAAAGPPEGRHRHAPGRAAPPEDLVALARIGRRRPDPRAGGGLDPLRRGRRARPPVHRRAARPLRRRARRAGGGRASSRR